jgi:hypothetical protein
LARLPRRLVGDDSARGDGLASAFFTTGSGSLSAAIATMLGHGTRCGMRPACATFALALARHSSIGEPVTMRT